MTSKEVKTQAGVSLSPQKNEIGNLRKLRKHDYCRSCEKQHE